MSAGAATLAAALAAALGRRVEGSPAAEVRGGCINTCWRWETAAGPVFVKQAPAARLAMLEAERDGLLELHAAGAVRVPAPLAVGAGDEVAFLALEWIDLREPTPAVDERFGEQLAMLHRVRADRYGWDRDNTLGSTPQPNGWVRDWVHFLRERRLGYQLDLALQNGHGGRLQDRGRRLLEAIDVFFATYRPAPSLLHGDLWGGNWGADASGRPVIYDPAVYHGDREADLAMTRLFGGFGPAFYSAYVTEWPLDAAAGTRRDL
ncbi:MAG TPA: fructosamine kinase family protein, partial [Rubrivivax sp.]|nr:fructosamine kinase family protein [Rubrivivax sp.]